MSRAGTALVTGGSGALGEAVVSALRGRGFDVVVGARGNKAVSEGIPFVTLDVTNPESIASAVAARGPFAALVHLVGAYKGGLRVQETPVETWEAMVRVNLSSAFLCARAVLPAMIEANWGRIVFVSSRSAYRGLAGNGAYSVAKSGLAALAGAIAEETRGTGITANVVAPSTVDTPANRAAWPDAKHECWVSPDNVAETISFLVSDAAGDVRGAWLPVYGSV